MQRIVFRFLCVLLLLLGQEAALMHAISHVQERLARGTPVTADEATPHGHDKSQGDRFALCDFDFSFSQMLGGVGGKAPSCPTSDAVHAFHPASDAATRVARLLVPYSRGPPARS